jgi:hypothetical protein
MSAGGRRLMLESLCDALTVRVQTAIEHPPPLPWVGDLNVVTRHPGG